MFYTTYYEILVWLIRKGRHMECRDRLRSKIWVICMKKMVQEKEEMVIIL